MAKKTTPDENPMYPDSYKSYRRESKFHELNAGDTLRGILLSVREQKIRDKRTRQPKDVLVYRIELPDGSKIMLAGRALLDQQFQDVADDIAGGDVRELRNLPIIINRGEDGKTRDNNPMGTYELLVQVPEI